MLFIAVFTYFHISTSLEVFIFLAFYTALIPETFNYFGFSFSPRAGSAASAGASVAFAAASASSAAGPAASATDGASEEAAHAAVRAATARTI
jgi:hypothetical protein